ncbi:MAG: PilN domain-containing protein [Candidatus Riflebacteria bacterium]|nr:PilN domain-containing protein [Candidatus Riflebacteria bacterium]
MIKVNLITVKRSKPIQIPYAAIFLVIALLAILGAFYIGTTMMDGWNQGLVDEKNNLDAQVKASAGKFSERDRLRQDLSMIEFQIEQLKQLSGANLLQWSEVFSTLTRVVPEKTVWVTNMRIDSDRRVQMTGFACSENQDEEKESPRLTLGIQNFIKQLQDNPYFDDVFLTNANKNVYEKSPVWRFDISCRIKRDVEAKH